MRKRLMNISKRCMVAIMSAAMLMSSVTVSMAFPVGVYALDNDQNILLLDYNIDTNNADITMVSAGKRIETNNGSIGENDGWVKYNNHNNNNEYDIKQNAGIVDNNNGIINQNFSSVVNNYGTINKNTTGTVTNNYGTIKLNGYTITNQYDGTVESGNGRIDNLFGGTVSGNNNIVNYFGGTIDGNNGTVTNNFSTTQIAGANQFYSVNFIEPEDGTISYGTGFTAKNDNEYVQVTGTNAQAGVITISPAQGKEIIGEEKTDENGQADATFTYSLVKQNDGSFKLTIKPDGNITNLGIGLLGLAIQTIQQNENVPITSVVIQDIENSNDNTSNNSGDQAQDSSSVFSLTNFMQNRLMTGQTGRNIIDFKTNTCLTTDGMEYLLSKNNATDCYFDYEGARYVLHIPASSGIDPQKKNAAFEALKKEYGGMAGFMTIAILFKECGVWFEEIPQQAIANTVAAPGVAPAQNVAAPALASVMTAFVDPALMGEADYTEEMVSMISVAPYGGTIELNTNDSAYLNESIISSLETRTDVALRMKVTVNAVPYVISIPAGHNLRALEDENRKIDMQKLIDTFANAR